MYRDLGTIEILKLQQKQDQDAAAEVTHVFQLSQGYEPWFLDSLQVVPTSGWELICGSRAYHDTSRHFVSHVELDLKTCKLKFDPYHVYSHKHVVTSSAVTVRPLRLGRKCGHQPVLFPTCTQLLFLNLNTAEVVIGNLRSCSSR